MEGYRMCKNCIMDSLNDPEFFVDRFGICNYCKEYKKNEAIRQKEKVNLPKLVEEIKKQNGNYNCLIGLSGGVDSSLALHYICELGLKPLAFSIDNGWNTPESDENIMRLVETLKVPFYRFTIDLSKFRDLQAAFMESGTTNIEIPTDHILMASTYEMANKNGIKYIISGGNLATESIMPKSYGHQARDLRFIKSVYRKHRKSELKGLPVISLFQYLKYRFIKGIRVINLLDYYEYNREEAKRLLNEKYGWKDYGEKHCESTFTWWFQNFYLFEKFGLDKRRPHFSSLINSGQMTRKDALEALKVPPVYPRFGIEKKVMDYPKRSYKDYSNSDWLWNLLSKIYGYIK